MTHEGVAGSYSVYYLVPKQLRTWNASSCAEIIEFRSLAIFLEVSGMARPVS